METAEPVQLSDKGRALTPPYRHALFEVKLEEEGAGGGVVHRRGPSKCVLGGCEESIFQDPRLGGSPPKILIHTVRRLRLDINRQFVLARVDDLLLPRH